MLRPRWFGNSSASLAGWLLSLLVAAAAPGQSAPSLAPAADGALPVEKDSRLTVELSDGSTLMGHPVGETTLRLATSLGELDVPLAKIAGVQFQAAPTATLVLLPNGDRMTGKLSGGPIALKAVWGEVVVELQYVAAIGSSDAVIQKVTVADRMPDGRIERRVVAQVRLVKDIKQRYGDTQPAAYPSTTYNGTSYNAYPTPTPASPYDSSLPSLPPVAPPAFAPPDDPDDVPAPDPK